jgi:hypothetical protein
MKLDTYFFKKDCKYDNNFINRCIFIIKFSNDEKRIAAYKNYVFRAMKSAVRKNMYNFLNLMRSIKGCYIPENDEVIMESYIIFNKCLLKYKVSKNNNFYFYFNKSLSRNFYRTYQKEFQSVSVEMTEAMLVMNPLLRSVEEIGGIEVILHNFKFNDSEKRIIRSRLKGQKTSEFLSENDDISNSQYSRAFRHIKEIITNEMEEFL